MTEPAIKNPARKRAVTSVLAVALPALLAAVAIPGVLTLQATPAAAASSVHLPLSTSGSRIVDADGNTVVLHGVNWFGLETANHAPHGLWTRDYKDMLAQIKSLGFNVLRLPFSLQALRSSTTSGIDYGSGRNAALRGKTPLQVMDEIIAEAGRQGLMVILDNHSQADDGYMYDLWYGQDGYTEDDWLASWKMLAERYASVANVVGYDLKNEPHGRATWGTGGPTDWRLAAERAGKIVLASDPDALVLVEGIEGAVSGGTLDRNWWGGNLEGVKTAPVRLGVPGHVVYSPHEYGPGVYAQPWFTSPDMASILAQRWQAGFGYISAQGIAPVLVGEFGAKSVSVDTVEGRWITQFADYLTTTGTSWTFWAWNPNSGDTGGVLNDDWTTVHADKMALLSAMMSGRSLGLNPSPSPKASSSGTLTGSVAVDSQWPGGSCIRLVVRNGGTAAAAISQLAFDLAAGSTVSSVWNGTIARVGDRYTITTPAWAKADPGATYGDTGLCITGTSVPSVVAVNGVWPSSTSSSPTPTTTPSPTASATVTPTATATATPTMTVSPGAAPSSSSPNASIWLRAALTRDSAWETGSCYTVVVSNIGSTAVNQWHASFQVPAGARIDQSWSGGVAVAGQQATVTAPVWGATITAGGTVRHFGFCLAGAGQPSDPIAW